MDNERQDLPSASEMPRLRRCPGAFNARRAMPARKDNADATAGTERHSLIEIEADTETIEDQNTAYTVGRANELMEEARIEARLNGVGLRIVKEQRYWLYDDELNRVCSARLDRLEMDDDTGTGLVIDFKTLFGDHGKAVENEQLFAQVVCADGIENFSEAYTALIQPNLERDRQLTMAHMDRRHIQTLKRDVIGWSKAAMDPDAPRIPGPVQCKNCPAAADCPEAESAALAWVSATQRIKLMQPQELVHYVRQLPMVKAVASAIESRAKSLLDEDENAFDGEFIMKPGKKRVNFRSIGKTASILSEAGVKLPEFQETLKPSITSATALYAEAKCLSMGKARNELEYALAEAEAIEITNDKPSLAKGK